jgi:hypothetical protein
MPAFTSHTDQVSGKDAQNASQFSMTDLTGLSDDDLQRFLAAGDASGLNQEAQGSLIGLVTIAAHC